MSVRTARRDLERAALAWIDGLDDNTGDGKAGVDMDALDARLFEACRAFADARKRRSSS